MGLTGFCFHFNLKNFSPLLFFVCIVITYKYCICTKIAWIFSVMGSVSGVLLPGVWSFMASPVFGVGA